MVEARSLLQAGKGVANDNSKHDLVRRIEIEIELAGLHREL